MFKIILGIHGLRNKPPKKLLEQWWKDAMKEGLRAIGHPRSFFKFKLVYWADFLYPEPLDPNVQDKKSPHYMDNPYVPARTEAQKRPIKLRAKVLDYIERQFNKIVLNKDFSINYTSITDLIIRRYFRDLDIYYSKTCQGRKKSTCQAKDVIREELARMLRKYRRRDILLIGHSMGSIIAYDVLTHSASNITIHTLVTMGSPLGLPPIMLKILSEQHKKPQKHITVTTPENITKAWYNFSDSRDKVATHYNLRDDYEENSRHIRAIDAIICNDYEYQEKPNPHNAYGYLRTKEMAQVILNFLNAGRPKAFIWLSDKINRFLK